MHFGKEAELMPAAPVAPVRAAGTQSAAKPAWNQALLPLTLTESL